MINIISFRDNLNRMEYNMKIYINKLRRKTKKNNKDSKLELKLQKLIQLN